MSVPKMNKKVVTVNYAKLNPSEGFPEYEYRKKSFNVALSRRRLP